MCKQARSRIFFFLLVLAVPLTVCAQSHERFWVVPGDESGLGGDGSLQTVFEFTADVTDAKCYQLNFGDSDSDLYRYKSPEKPQDSGGRAAQTYRYEKAGTYSVMMRAWRLREGDDDREVNCADLSGLQEPIELALRIVVRATAPARQAPLVATQPPPPVVSVAPPPVVSVAPPPVAAVQWPAVRPVPTVRAKPSKPNILPWLLLAAIAVLLSQRSGLTYAELGTFEATRDRGNFDVIGIPTASDAVSMRVWWRNEHQFRISEDAVVLKVRPQRGATRHG